ncbi:MAG: DUF4346 domain-containing protein [Abditibacteriota bacterium]|nr:DUF4346 domain-containing protein [Abditibacteriota bacterium]
MEFEPLFYADKLHLVNPSGCIGVVCLWTKQEHALKKLAEAGIDLGPSSKIALVGNLYGNGISELAANLMYNPQIQGLLICGSNMSGSAEDLIALYTDGIREAEQLGSRVRVIAGRDRVVNNALDMSLAAQKPVLCYAGDFSSPDTLKKAADFVSGFTPSPVTSERIAITMEKPAVTVCPTEPRSLVITRDDPLSAWRELVFCLNRFGVPVMLRKGERRELQNVKVVIRDFEADPEELKKYGFRLSELEDYRQKLLSGYLPPDQEYTYGNRIREYYGFDFLQNTIDKLSAYENDRDCYLSLWDPRRDTYGKDAPCMVSLFFRVFQGELTLTAVFRTHNGMDAWLKNAWGIRGLQEYVGRHLGMKCGPLTVISHSISIDTSRNDFARRVADSKQFVLNTDYNGRVEISTEDGEIAVTHTRPDGTPINVYRGTSTERLQHELYRDNVLSDIGHAIFTGLELEKAKAVLDSRISGAERPEKKGPGGTKRLSAGCPTEPRSLVITRDDPLGAWKELVFCLDRFGVPVMLRKGERRELQNVKVVIRDFEVNPEELKKYGFTLSGLEDFRRELFREELPPGAEYTCGNRIREYYGFDFLQCVIDKLSVYSNDRDCYLSLWDPKKDTFGGDVPSLTSLFFRVFQGGLTLTAVYRTHNVTDAWLKNVYGLRGLQEYVAKKLELKCGPMTVISMSVSIDAKRSDFARRVAEEKGFALNMDYNGQVLIMPVDGEIAVTHTRADGTPIKVYKSRDAETLARELVRDNVLSDINHAIYIGRELEKARAALEKGSEYVQA